MIGKLNYTRLGFRGLAMILLLLSCNNNRNSKIATEKKVDSVSHSISHNYKVVDTKGFEIPTDTFNLSNGAKIFWTKENEKIKFIFKYNKINYALMSFHDSNRWMFKLYPTINAEYKRGFLFSARMGTGSSYPMSYSLHNIFTGKKERAYMHVVYMDSINSNVLIAYLSSDFNTLIIENLNSGRNLSAALLMNRIKESDFDFPENYFSNKKLCNKLRFIYNYKDKMKETGQYERDSVTVDCRKILE